VILTTGDTIYPPARTTEATDAVATLDGGDER